MNFKPPVNPTVFDVIESNGCIVAKICLNPDNDQWVLSKIHTPLTKDQLEEIAQFMSDSALPF